MRLSTEQFKGKWTQAYMQPDFQPGSAQLVMAFGDRSLIQAQDTLAYLQTRYPKAHIVLSSTSGEILEEEVHDQTIVASAIQFDSTSVACVSTSILQHEDSFHAGLYLRSCFEQQHLRLLFVLSDGTLVNGSELVQGINHESFAQNIMIAGGLAGDGESFAQTVVGHNQTPVAGQIVVIGFYGDQLQVGCGSFGGWDEFGPERIVTRSNKNILYEIDGRNALDLYKEYLGPFKSELPGSALLFPISVRIGAQPVVTRTILSIDELNQSMVFAGNIPVGSKVRLMKANFEKLIQASKMAASSIQMSSAHEPALAILVSCVGRKMILRQRTYEEIHSVRKMLGHEAHIIGFYSYGEISPNSNTPGTCDLHNQTMTITVLSESGH